MKTLTILSLTLLLSLTLSEISVCEAQYVEIMKSIGVVVKIALKAQKHLKPFLEKHNKTLDDHAIQSQKLDKLSSKIESMEKEMLARFKELLQKVEDIPTGTIHKEHASKFEKYMQTIGQTLGDLISKKGKVNRGELTLDDHFKREVEDYNSQLLKYKTKLEVLMWGKDHSFDFLEQVKKNADACKDKMTQVQLLDGFRALYVDTVSRYLMAKHIIISLWESADKISHDDKKRELNSEVRRYLLTYAKRFQDLMATSSREYQHCTTPSDQSRYMVHSSGRQSTYCYQTGEGDLANQVVVYDTHWDSGLKQCYDFVSTRPAKARPGYVVVGASIERNGNVLYLKIVEGKLLPNGIIDPDSITHNADPAPGIGDHVIQLHYRDTPFDITATVAPDDRVITGLKFAQSEDKHVYLEVISTKLDLDKGILIDNTSRSEPHQRGLTKYAIRKYSQRNNTIIRNNGVEPVKPNQFVQFVFGGKVKFHPPIELGDVLPTPITLLSGVSLYVRQVKDTQGYLSIRLHTFNIVPHVTKIDFELNEDFADALKSIR